MKKTVQSGAMTAHSRTVVLSILGIIGVMLMFSSCSVSFDQTGYHDGLAIHYGELSGYAFAGEYEIEEPCREITINVPDSYEGHPVKQLGGYFGMGVPTPFGVYFSYQHFYHSYYSFESDIIDISYNLPDESRWVSASDAVILPMTVTVNIGPNVSAIGGPNAPGTAPASDSDDRPLRGTGLYMSIDCADEKVFYIPAYYFNCSEENTTFYSKNGRLYFREDDRLVEYFAYWDGEVFELLPMSEQP